MKRQNSQSIGRPDHSSSRRIPAHSDLRALEGSRTSVTIIACCHHVMDPQSQSFTPVGSQAEAAQVNHILLEHSERIARLERQNNDDARLKSLWGHTSAFPSILSGTPQQGQFWIDAWMPLSAG